MSFEMWLFAVKGFAQTYEMAQLIYAQLPQQEKDELLLEYEEYQIGKE